MYKVNEVAQKFNVNPNILRFYEKKKLLAPARDENGYRSYSVEDMLRFQTILLYRKMGFSLENITLMLKNDTKPVEIFFKQYGQLNHHIHAMKKISESLEECLLFMFHEDGSEAIDSCMKKTAKILDEMENWEDKWGFDHIASQYDTFIKESRPGLDFYKNYEKVIQMTADKVNEKKGQVAEIGVGTGNLAGKLMNNQDVIGIDQSINMLMEAKIKFPALKLRTGTFLELPLQKASIDTIVSSYAFHHCNENEKTSALKEMDRALKPNGRIIITDLMFYDNTERKNFEASAAKEELDDLQDEFFSTVVNLKAQGQSLGYSCSWEQIDALIWMVVLTKTD